MSTITSTAATADFSSQVGATVNDFVAGLHRINARRSAGRAAAAPAAPSLRAERSAATVPALSAAFGYVAWRS